MMITLTDRYIATALRLIPGKTRSDIGRELRATIADSVEARLEQGESPGQAERAALTELGDPSRLAARYLPRPTSLIGPEVYPVYRYSLRGMCMTVLPLLYVVLAVMFYANNDGIWAVIFRSLGITVTAGMYVVVLLTAVYALVDRVIDARPSIADWSPDQMVELDGLPHQAVPVTRAALIGDIVRDVMLIGVLVVLRTIPLVRDHAGTRVPILNPHLWQMPYFIVLLGLSIVFGAVRFRWSGSGPRWAAAALTAAGVIPLVWLLWDARLINPALADRGGVLATLTTRGNWISIVAILVIVLAAAGHLYAARRQIPTPAVSLRFR